METQTERLVPSDEGAGEARTEIEIQPQPTELDIIEAAVGELAQRAAIADNAKTAALVDAEISSEQQPEVEPQPAGPPPGYEGVAPELWPDKDGNPPKLTEKLMCTLRRKYFTVRHPLLTECGHKLDMINFPKTNCQNCLFQFFNTHPQLVEVTDQFFKTHGKAAVVQMRGVKYFKAFVRYMATVYHFMKEEGRLNDEPTGVQQEVVSGQSGATVEGVKTPISREVPASPTLPPSGLH